MKSKRKAWIAYVGPFPFPWGLAGSRRICGIARSLADAGRSVVIGSGDAFGNGYNVLDEGEDDGSIRYIGLGELPEKDASYFEKSLRIFFEWGARTLAWLEAQPIKPSHVIVYGGAAQYIFRLLPWCKKNGVKLIVDVVEWYDPRQMKGGIFGPFNISAKLALKYLYPKCDGIIAISHLLAEHYMRAGCKVIRVPPTFDIEGNQPATRSQPRETSKIILVYAGSPGKKDLLGNIVSGLMDVDPAAEKFELRVLGPTVPEVERLIPGGNIPSNVQVLGNVPQRSVVEHVANADFSVLLREPLRFANAGFPTKFVESLAVGTPVIANITSDLNKYLHDGIEGVICSDHSVTSFSKALNRTLQLTSEERSSMRQAARDQARRSFDFREYSDPLSKFFDNI